MHLLIKFSKLLLIPWSTKSSNFISINFEVASKVIFLKDLGFNKHSMNKDSRSINLSNSVSIITYEYLRQNNFSDL